MVYEGYIYYTEIEDVYVPYSSSVDVYVEDGNWIRLVPTKLSSMCDKIPEVVKAYF